MIASVVLWQRSTRKHNFEASAKRACRPNWDVGGVGAELFVRIEGKCCLQAHPCQLRSLFFRLIFTWLLGKLTLWELSFRVLRAESGKFTDVFADEAEERLPIRTRVRERGKSISIVCCRAQSFN